MRIVTTLALMTFVALLGCSNTPAPAGRPTCDLINDTCHPLDPGSGPIHDCHENSESASATEATCQAARAACLAICVARDAGNRDASSSHSHEGDADDHGH